jgi:hypothetical protein
MVKKLATRDRRDRPPIAVTLRGDPDWKQWLLGLADHCRLDVATLIDKALVHYAKDEEYNQPAPLR